MTTYVSSSYSLSSVMFSYILAQMRRHSPQAMENPTLLCDRNSAECHIPSYSYIALISGALLKQHPCHIARAAQFTLYCFPAKILWVQMWTKPWFPLPYLHLEVNTEATVLGS